MHAKVETKGLVPEAGEPPSELVELVALAGRFWARSHKRPQPDAGTLRGWDRLVHSWAYKSSLPLFVRKQSLGRGSVLRHSSGRAIIPTDNSPAKWAFVQALKGYVPTLTEVRALLKQDRVPVAKAFKKEERLIAEYHCLVGRLEKEDPNSIGWKVGHADAVGLGFRADYKEIEIGRLQDHFVRLMSPSNMFVVHLKYAGLAELPEFYREFRRH